MMKSRIPLLSKKSAQSSIPVPTNRLGTKAKNSSLNAKEEIISKKPATVKRTTISSKVGENNGKSGKRSLSQDCKSNVRLDVKSSSKLNNAKKPSTSKPLTENKSVRQAKPAPVRQPSRNGPFLSKSVSGKENQPKRFSTFKANNDIKASVSVNKSKTINKSVLRTKIANQDKKRGEISVAVNEKTKPNKNVTVKENIEKVAASAPASQTHFKNGCDVDDADFKESGFFKSLILNQRELSPGIIKKCSKPTSTVNNNLLKPQQKFSLHFKSTADFVEEVVRNSSKYYRLNGRLVPHSPRMLKLKEKSSADVVEEIRRNSAMFLQGKRNLLSTPCLGPKNSSSLRGEQAVSSAKEFVGAKFVDEVRRLSEFRQQSSQNADLFLANRRWTCNVSTKPIASMNTSELAAEMLRLAEIRRESGAQLVKKATFFGQQYSAEKLNPHQKVLRDLECLTAKKKKKVAFLIPSPGSPNLAAAVSSKTEAKLSDISEGSSNNCTPELNLNSCKIATIPETGDIEKHDEETSVITTPELNLNAYEHKYNSPTKKLNETHSFDVLQKSDKSFKKNLSDNQTVLSEKDQPKNITEQCFKDSNAMLYNLKSDILSSKLSSLQIMNDNTTPNKLTSFESSLTNTNNDSYSEFSEIKSTDCLFQAASALNIPSQPVNETERFCVRSERKIYTPHPVALHSKSNLSSSVSPSFLSSKFTTLNSNAPIYTPLVLKNLAQSPEISLNDVRQRLDFVEKPNLTMDRRESQIILQSIPTQQKMNDFLCDQECLILSSQCSEEDVTFRNLKNPIASILLNGDEMHFIPVYSP